MSKTLAWATLNNYFSWVELVLREDDFQKIKEIMHHKLNNFIFGLETILVTNISNTPKVVYHHHFVDVIGAILPPSLKFCSIF